MFKDGRGCDGGLLAIIGRCDHLF